MDYGYGDPDPNPDGGSTQQFTMDYWINNIKSRQADGYPLSAQDQDILAHPDDYFVSGSGGPTKKNFANQHQGLVEFLAAAAPFVAGGAGALFSGAGGAASTAPELVGTTADTAGGLGSVGAAGAADAGTFGAGAGAGAGAGGAGEFAAVGGVSGLPEGLPGVAPIFSSGTVAAAAPAAGGFVPAAAPAFEVAGPAVAGVDQPQGPNQLLSDPQGPNLPPGSNPSYKQIADLIKAAGAGIGGADSASQNNAIARAKAQLAAAAGEENAYLSDAELEAQQRKTELGDVYRSSALDGHSPYDPAPPVASPQYRQTVSNLAGQGATDLAQKPIYGIRDIPNPKTLGYPDPNAVGSETGLQKVGDWLSPALTIAGSVPPSIYSKIFSWL